MSAVDDFTIQVSAHAALRWRQRVGGAGGAAKMASEVRAAMREGRFSKLPPKDWIGQPRSDASYAWSADQARIYVLAVHSSMDAWVVTTVIVRSEGPAPRVAPSVIRPEEPTPTPQPASPSERRKVEHRLVDDLSSLKLRLGPDPLHLPPTPMHEPRVTKAKGKWVVTCSCGSFRASGNESRRPFLEEAWGVHRHEL